MFFKDTKVLRIKFCLSLKKLCLMTIHFRDYPFEKDSLNTIQRCCKVMKGFEFIPFLQPLHDHTTLNKYISNNIH